IEQQWGIRVDESTISRIFLKKDEQISSQIINSNAKHHRAVTYPELDQALKEFVLIYQNKTILSNAILVKKAKLFANGLGIPEGEAESADEVAIINALPALRNKCSNYPIERIYNMDETGLFFKLEPDRSLATQCLSGRKVDKERLSIALCTNANGSHKMVTFVIGKYAKPRCFKNINFKNLAVMYKNSAKAWMITSLFQTWLQEFDYQISLKYQGQHVLLVLDNCSSYKLDGLTLQFTDIVFLPSRAISRIQPLDAGIIMSFKRHYHRPYIRWILKHVEKSERADGLKMDILQAIHFIIQGWDEHYGQTMDPALDDLTNALEDLCIHFDNPMPVEEFLSIPAEDVVYEIPTNNQVIEELIKTFKPVDLACDDSEDDNSIEIPLISIDIAITSLETVSMFLLQQDEAN
ncbi:25189_t:CDS:2, partial [Dentiscutata erythropus]